jgi:polar amino acid transport system substrate-binding protein
VKPSHNGILLGLMLLARTAMATETVVIAAEDDWPPYSSMKADHSGPEGFAVDIVREAFKSQGIEVKFEVLPFARCMHYAETGQVTGCFDATIVASNRSTYCWHRTPMFKESLQIFGPASTPRTNLTVKDLEGKVVGSTTGYTYPDSFSKNKKIIHFEGVSDAHLIKMLAAGRVNFILLNGMPGYMRINADPKLKNTIKALGTLSDDGFWVAFTKQKEGPHFCKVFEKGLQTLHQNGKYKTMETGFRKRLNF